MPLLIAWVLAVAFVIGLIYRGSVTSNSKPDVVAKSEPTPQRTSSDRPSKPHAPAQNHKPVEVSPPPAQVPERPSPAEKNREGPRETPQKAGVVSPKPVLDPPPHFTTRDISPDEAPTPKAAEPNGLKLALAPRPQAPPGKLPQPAGPPVPPTVPHVARVAIVIDDFGQDLETARKFLAIPLNITFSILPNQRYTREIAELAHTNRRDALLHLPMEPQGYPKSDPGPGALMLSMSKDKMRKTLLAALDSSPYYSGVNNHMGSRFTEDENAMRTILAELRRRGLIFIDSGTGPKSVAHSLALQLQVPSRRRDVFLDHTHSQDFISSQIDRLIRKARIEGTALAIGHPYENTRKILTDKAKRFEKEGIVVVSVKELVNIAPGESGMRN